MDSLGMNKLTEHISWFSAVPEQVQLVIRNIRNGWLGLFVLIISILYIGDTSQVALQVWALVGAVTAIGHGLLVHSFLYRDKKSK